MRTLAILLLLVLTSCETKSVYKHHSKEIAEAKYLQSRKLISKRKSLLIKVSLQEKADFFEKYILKRMHSEHKFCPKLYKDGLPGTLRMDMTALFLSSLAYKYAADKDEIDKTKILEILDSIYLSDKSNGLDGFIPYKVKIEKDKLLTESNNTHINVYTQLLFAYIPLLTYSNDKEIEIKVLKHLKLIISHLQKSNFTLVDNDGNEVEYSDLSPRLFTLQSNRQQLLLVFVDLALKYSLGKNMSELRHKLTEMGYEQKIQDLHFKFLNLEFPTHSSSWLNLSNSFIGFLIEKKDYYKSAYKNLHKHYEDEKNILFELMLCSMENRKDKLDDIEDRLKSFPLNPSNHEVINSLDPKLNIIQSPAYTKLKREVEVHEPLPFYRRPIRSFEWKLNQMRVDGNFNSKGPYTYTGIDYLIAYWMLRWLQKSSS